MTQTAQLDRRAVPSPVPERMLAAVYRGANDVRVETVNVPVIGRDELLVKIHTCGICGTDLKKIAAGTHSAPRIFGHEMSGTIAKVGDGIAQFAPGDRVMVFHHVPCGRCFYCSVKVYAQCPVYKRVGAGAGFEPSGGGFAEYIRVSDWVVPQGVVKVPDGVSFEQASFIEPVNTCLKAIRSLRLSPGETVLVMGAGPIGIILGVLAMREGARVIASDLHTQRLRMAESFGIPDLVDASSADVIDVARSVTDGRGADAVVLAVAGNALVRAAMAATRPGGRTMLFAQTQRSEVAIDPAEVCVDEKTLMGSYSASVDLQSETVDLVFRGGIEFSRLISHRFKLKDAVAGLQLAANPQPDSMKIVIQP
jgi:L-iditol 2-dehydrogenase